MSLAIDKARRRASAPIWAFSTRSGRRCAGRDIRIAPVDEDKQQFLIKIGYDPIG
jgi:hypothetical protein